VLRVVVRLEDEEGGADNVGVVVVLEGEHGLLEDFDVLESIEIALNTDEVGDALQMNPAPHTETGATAAVSLLLLNEFCAENILSTMTMTPLLPVTGAEEDLCLIGVEHDPLVEDGLVNPLHVLGDHGLALNDVGGDEGEFLLLCKALEAESGKQVSNLRREKLVQLEQRPLLHTVCPGISGNNSLRTSSLLTMSLSGSCSSNSINSKSGVGSLHFLPHLSFFPL
jgi:hypothetical protein